MKKIISVVFILAGICYLLSSCAHQKTDMSVKPDNMSIVQGVSSYAYFGADKIVTEELYDYVTSLDYEKIGKEQAEEEGHFLTRFSIIFACGKENILNFHIDKNGIFWFETYENGILIESDNEPDIQFYKVTGDYNYDFIYDIYASQRNKSTVPLPGWQSILKQVKEQNQ